MVRSEQNANLTLTLSAVEIESNYDYEGNLLGTATASQVVKFSGEEAEVAWDRLLEKSIS